MDLTYIFDIDGTLADISHRLHFIQNKPADWRGFFAACPADAPIPEVIEVAKALQTRNYIALITGRSDEVRFQTVQWMIDQGIHFSDLLMRTPTDHRADYLVKAELFDELLLHHRLDSIGGVFEDRQQVVDMYRGKGLRVFQVDKGDF